MVKTRLLFSAWVTLLFMSLLFGSTIHAEWYCESAAPTDTNKQCVERPQAAGGTAFNTLRGCLRGEDDFTQPEKAGCNTDSRYVLRNFAPLDYWSVGKVITFVLPLSTIVAAFIAGAFLASASFTYITAQGDPKKIEESTRTITWAAAGLVFVLVAYILVRVLLTITQTNTFGF